jgi:poly-gamma-glutamate synthesis protein (capsule biosynthesis protein)
MKRCALIVLVILFAACGGPRNGAAPTAPGEVSDGGGSRLVTTGAPDGAAGAVRLLLAGDVMLGRSLAPIVAEAGPELLEGVRHVVTAADIAAGNLESPLTQRPHIVDNPNELEADPAAAALLAGAGFDLMALANNHTGDAGAEGVRDGLAALESAGIGALGAGVDDAAAGSITIVSRNGLRIAFLAYDATGTGLAATATSPGVARYAAETARAAVTAAAASADVVVVAVHGGIEYLLATDPVLGDIAGDLVAWGADIVWGHGPHVPQPVLAVDAPAGGHAVVATSLGNLLFDQQRAATQVGLLLEVLVSADGVVAYRVGRAEHGDLRPRFIGWDLPEGPAAHLDGEWWSLVASPELAPGVVDDVAGFTMGDVTTAALGDATGDGRTDLVVSYRHPFRENPVNSLFPSRDWVDAADRSAHLGVFDPANLEAIWAAGTMAHPVASVAVCDGSVALAFDSLDDPAIVGTSAWAWRDFGFVAPLTLPGPGVPGCVDVDGDGRKDAVIVGR